MKKSLFTIIVLALMASCSVKTNEEKARDLIEPELKANMIKPESFELTQIKLDSCFSDDSHRNADAVDFGMKVAKLYKKYNQYKSDADDAEKRMNIYAPSYGYESALLNQQYRKFKDEMERSQRKAAAAKDEIIQLYKDNKRFLESFYSGRHEFTGWVASAVFRVETAGGTKTMGGAVLYLNKDLTKITHIFTEQDTEELLSVDLDDLKYEFEDELKDIFEDDISKNKSDNTIINH